MSERVGTEELGELAAERSDWPDADRLRAVVEELAGYSRPSASEGERRAAEWIAERLATLGFDARVEAAPAHGTYWWPLGLPLAASFAAGAGVLGASRGGRPARFRRRATAAAIGAAAAWAVADDIADRGQRLRRHVLPRRTSWTAIGERPGSGSRTLVLLVHHDAARAGLIFHPAPRRFLASAFPGLMRRMKSTPPIMWLVVAGPATTAAGALLQRRGLIGAGMSMAAFFLGGFLDMLRRPTVAGADDNLSGVAAMIEVARAVGDGRAGDPRLMFVSTGAEEAFLEGMREFAKRHFPELDPASTYFICLDTVGSPRLVLFEGEGMLRMREYHGGFKDLTEACARDVGVPLERGMRLRNATDGRIAMGAGYPAISIASMDAANAPSNYHWPTDTPDNVVYGSVANAARVCLEVIRRAAQGIPAT